MSKTAKRSLYVRGYDRTRQMIPDHRADIESDRDPKEIAQEYLTKWGCMRVRVYGSDSKALVSVKNELKGSTPS